MALGHKVKFLFYNLERNIKSGNIQKGYASLLFKFDLRRK